MAYVRQDANVNSEGTRHKEGRVLRRGRGVPKLQKKIDIHKEMSIFFVLNSYNGGFATLFGYKGTPYVNVADLRNDLTP